jgi:DNA-directed RNA polymerase II subunit RPB1
MAGNPPKQQLTAPGLMGGIRQPGARVPAVPVTAAPAGAGGRPLTQQQFAVGMVPQQAIPLLSQPENAVVITKKQRDEILTETAKKEAELPLLTITKSAISLYSWDDMQRIAGPIKVVNLNFQGVGSVNDPRMGVVSLSYSCQYCSQIDCPGHYGLIDFRHPIYNPAFIHETVLVLTSVCNDCGGLLIPEDLMRQQGLLQKSYDKRLAATASYCENHECLRQKPQLGGGTLVPCAKNPTFMIGDVKEKGEITFKVPEKGSKKVTKEDPIHLMPIETVISILDRISPKDSYLLGFPCYHRQYGAEVVLRILDMAPEAELRRVGLLTEEKTAEGVPHIVTTRQRSYEAVLGILDSLSEDALKALGFTTGSHPRNMILRGILVPPVIARPPVHEGGSMHHDQLTHMYVCIMRKVLNIAAAKPGAVAELYTFVKQLIFKTEGKKMGMRDFLSIVERIQGKNALLRGLLMGKRDNYCARTVAGPDPSLRYGQIGIPRAWAPVLTKKAKVTKVNIHNLTALLEASRITHITSKRTGLRKYYDPKYRYRLQIGDIVERWLQDGDWVVNNRQPTLHRQSVMAYEVVLRDQLTIGLHLSYTTPMNCDFDGDENNIWSPQDFEVEAEAEILMNVKENIMSSEQNRPIMGLVMNSITGVFLLSDSKTRIDDDLFAELLTLITNQDVLRTLYARLVKYGIHPRSGQAILSAMLPADFYYSWKGVQIIEGVLISGRLKKSHVGTSHRSIIQELYKKYDSQRTADFFTDAPWVVGKWLIERGFSVGLLDMVNLAIDEATGEEYDKNKRVLEQELAKIYVQLEALGGKLDDPIEESFRQRQINNLVNVAQGIGLRLAKDVLSGDNSIGVMTDQGAGTKGGVANIGQMMGSVGQQYYRGERLKPTLTGGKRLLPTYDEDDNNPEANAFIAPSFFTGLSPEGLFFLQAGGREGLLDTALKTSETGAMQHRMIKAFENIIIGYDGSIRNTIGTLFAPMYNAGYDIGEMLAVDTPGKPEFSSFIDLKSVVMELNMKRGWVPKDTNDGIVAARREMAEEVKGAPEIILPTPDPTYVKGPPVTDTTITYDIKLPVVHQGPITKITKFERARIIGTRATQLSNDAPPLVQVGDETDPVKISIMEYKAGVIQLYIVRRFADGSYQVVRPTLENI